MSSTISNSIEEKLIESRRIANLEPDLSMKMCTEALVLAKESGLTEKIGDCYIGMAFVARTKSDKSDILDYSFQALNEYKKINSKEGMAKAFNLIGIAYFYSAMYDEAIRYFVDGLDQLEKDDIPNLYGSFLNNIGEVYRESEMYHKALEYYEKAYDLSVKSDLKYYQATILGNIGEVYLIQGDHNKSLEYLVEAFDILKEGNDLVSMGEVANKIGKAQLMIGNKDSAVEYFKRSLGILDKVENQFYKIDVLSNLSQTKEDPEESIALLKDAISTALGVGAKKKLSDLYGKVSLQYENVMDYRTALSYHKKFFLINQEITNTNIRNKLEILNVEIKQLEEHQRLDQIKRTLEKDLEDNRKELEEVRRNNIILEKEAFEDELTEIPNRRSVNLELKRLLANYIGKRNTLAVFMIDIDNFKDYNDNWGHSEGDNCLKIIADELQSIAVKSEDFAGRYGGEEFVYISKASSYEEAIQIGEDIRKRIGNLGLKYDKSDTNVPVTVSVGGVFGRTIDFTGFSQIMEMADKELYRSKSEGRNRSNVILLENQ